MDNKAEKTGFQQATAATNRKTHKTDHVNADVKADPLDAQHVLAASSEGLVLVAPLMKALSRILSVLLTTLARLLPLILFCFILFNVFRAAVDSACKIPGSSYLSYCQNSGGGNEKFDALVSLQSRLISVQEIGAGGNTLPMQLEYSKNVVREVASIVRHSTVPSRDKIVRQLTEFWQLTDSTGDDIGNFLQGIDRMMDSVITRNELTLRKLRQIALSRAQPRSVGSQVVAILFHAPLTAEHAVRRQYLQHLDKLTGDIDTLILSSQLVELKLKQMADIQWDLRDLVIGDSQEIAQNEKEVQGRFWAWFGGYQGLLDNFKQQAAVLRGLDAQRGWAVDLVSDVTQTLKALRSRLGDLRIRIQEPGFDMAGDLELQIAIVEKGVDTLKTGRAKSKKVQQATIADVKRQIEAQKRE